MTAGSTADLSRWISAFVESAREPVAVESWVGRTVAAIEQGMPLFRRDALFAHDLRDAVEAQWRGFLGTLEVPTAEFSLVPAAQRFAVSCAQRRLALEDLLKVYRLAQAESWDYVTDVVRSAPQHEVDHTELLMRLWGTAGRWFDASVGASIEHFQAERHSIERGAAERRLALIEAVLSGRDVAAEDLTAGLPGYAASGFNTALVLHSGDVPVGQPLESVGRLAARALGSSNPLLVQPAGRELWVWVASIREPRPDDLDRVLRPDDLDRVLRQEDLGGVTVAAGTPRAGLDGFRTSHQEARAAQQLVLRHEVQAPLVRFEDVELLLLLGRDEDAARRFTDRVLGPLGEDHEGVERLRETLLALLEAGGSVEDAATALTVHKNTVRYRLSKVEALLGHPVHKASGELEAALRYHRLVTTSRV